MMQILIKRKIVVFGHIIGEYTRVKIRVVQYHHHDNKFHKPMTEKYITPIT